ncbi:hypothetical protein Tco_0017005 [Tanacetum coccineum]
MHGDQTMIEVNSENTVQLLHVVVPQISDRNIRADLLFDDANGVDCFPKQVIWDTLRDIGYEGTASLQGTAASLGTARLQGKLGGSREANSFSSKQINQAQRPSQETCLQIRTARNKVKGTLSEEHYVQEEDTADPFFDDIVDKVTEEINIEEKEASNVKSGDTEELDLETTQSTARQSTITPRTLNFEDEADHEVLSIPGSIQTQPQQSSQGTDSKWLTAKLLRDTWLKNPKEKKLTLQQIRALENTMIERLQERFKLNGMKRGKENRSWIQIRKNLSNPQMKVLYDKVSRINIKTSLLKILFQWAPRKKGCGCKKEMQRDFQGKEKLQFPKNSISKKHQSGGRRQLMKSRYYLEVCRFLIKGVHKKVSLIEGISMDYSASVEHGMEVDVENETAITLIHCVILVDKPDDGWKIS